MFFVISISDFTIYADDNTHYISGDSIDVIKSFDDDFKNLFKWLLDNRMKATCHKFHLKIGSINIKNSTFEKLLGVKVDNKLNFDEHLDGIIKKASRKVSALSRIFPFMNLTKRRFLMNSLFTSQFSYCPLI